MRCSANLHRLAVWYATRQRRRTGGNAVSFRSARVFGLCVIASAAIHAVVLFEMPGSSTSREQASPVLSAALQPAEPAPKPKPPPQQVQPPRQPAPAAKRTAPPPAPNDRAVAPVATQQAQAAAALIPNEVEAAAMGEAAPVDEPTAQASPQTDPAKAEGPPPQPRIANARDAEAVAAPVGAVATHEAAADIELPHAGTITYALYYGTDKFSVGRSVQTWTIDGSSYRLTSFSETTGLASLFRPYQYAYVSEGRVEASGLRPLTFHVRRGREGERQATARFDWTKGELTFGPIDTLRKVPLQAGTFDFLSFIYQLAMTQLTPGRMHLVITTGTKVNTYALEVGAEESVELPIGWRRAIPVKQVRIPGEESIQLWLAAEQPQLPIRIRFLDREGRMSVEQVAMKIEIDGA